MDVKRLGSPYPGIVAYDLKYSPVFFGRHLAVEHACEELLGAAAREGGRPVLFVIGGSGSGKSSLVCAGLVPRLTRPGVVPGVDLWRMVITVPDGDGLLSLAAHLYAPGALPELEDSAQRDPERWARMAAGEPEAAADSVTWALERIGDAERQRAHADRRMEAHLLLVLDQLEGQFGSLGQNAYAKVLRALVDGGRVWLLTTLRSERYTDLQLYPDLLALKRAGATYDLPPPGPAEIADIVRGPARAAGLSFDELDGVSLARVLVEAVPNADALPLLQMTLAQLFERRQGAELTFAAYHAMGGVHGAIAAYADGVFARVPPAAQSELDLLVRALVREVGRSKSDNHVRFTIRDADRKAFETSETRKQLVEDLVDGRLLVSDGDKLRLAHEALLRRWERARHSLRRLADAELRKAWLHRAMAAAAAVLFLVVAGVAVWFWRAATISASLDRGRLLAEQGRDQAEARPLLGLRLALEGLALAPERTDIRTPIVQTIAEIASRGRLTRVNAKAERVYSSDDGTKFVIVHAEGKSELRGISNGQLIQLTDKVGEWKGFFSPVFFVNGGRAVIVQYVNSLPEVRRTDTGALLATLQNRRVINSVSSDKGVFGVIYENQKPETEVRRIDTGDVVTKL